jgi:multidrug transporter EmrE-like cation transporter
MGFLKSPLLIVIGTQLLFTTSDVMARWAMKIHGFKLASFFSVWFLAYTVIRQVAVFGQLYVFSAMQLGRTMALFGAASIILSNLIGFLLLKETLTLPVYVGVTLAITAFLALALLPAGVKA